MPTSIPPWVPALFLVLVLIGYRQALPRTVKPGTLVAIALVMLGLSFYAVLGTFGAHLPGLLAWTTGYAASLVLGSQHLAPRLTASGAGVRVPGSWIPLAMLLGIFMARFVLGFAAATRAPWLQQPAFIVAISLALGALSGGFGARAVAVHRCAIAARPA